VKLPKDLLQEMAYAEVGAGIGGWRKADSEYVGRTRWGVKHRLVLVNDEGTYVGSIFEEGATEMQDYGPYDDAPDDIEVTIVEPIEVTQIRWLPVED